jgi:hypothetical protein
VAVLADVRHPEATKEQDVPDKLDEVNACLARYEVTMFAGPDGKYRIWGDINRIQDIVDGPCAKLFPPGARGHLDEFFAKEVDSLVAHCLVKFGVDAVIDPATGPGIEIKGPPPTNELMDICFGQAYDWFRVPPDRRP